jgi:hypothetical protein
VSHPIISRVIRQHKGEAYCLAFMFRKLVRRFYAAFFALGIRSRCGVSGRANPPFHKRLLLVISPHQSIYFPRLRDMMTRITSDVPANMVCMRPSAQNFDIGYSSQ